MISSLRLVTIFASIALVFGGACLNDGNTAQSSSAWNQRLWSYSPKSAATPSTSSSLTFTSFNLQSSISSDCKSNPQTQSTFMMTDYVGNQEVVQGVDTRCNCNMPKIIADQTGKSTRFVMTFPWRSGQYGINAGSSQTIVDTKYHLFSANSEQRALVAIKTFPPALKGRALWFISTHLDYTVWAARQSQATQLVQWVRENIISKDSSASVVVVGDFNGASDDGFYGIMKGLFKNTWEVKNGSPSGGATYPANWPSYRFDHIWFYTPSSIVATVESVEIVRTLASDHLPLHATIKFTVPGSSTPAPTPAPTSAPTKAATSAPTPAPTKAPTAAPTSAPTKAATSAPTPAPTKAPTAAPTSAPSGSCSAALDWNASGNNVVIRNTGSKAIKTIQITFGPSLPSNSWNWVATSSANVFTIPEWAFQNLGAGNSYTGSGYWVSGNRPSATVTRISC